MKTNHCLTFLIALFTTCNVFAQQSVPSKLTGVWQICTSFKKGINNVPEYKTGLHFKILSFQGDLTNMFLNPAGGKSAITCRGSYQQTSDSTFVENIIQSINPSLNGKANEIKFKIIEGKYLYIRFYVEKFSNGMPLENWLEELWVKVEEPVSATPKTNPIHL